MTLIFVSDGHIQDLYSSLSLGLASDEVRQDLESAGLYEAHHFPLLAHDILALNLLDEAENLVLDRTRRLLLSLLAILVGLPLGSLDGLLEHVGRASNAQPHSRPGNGYGLVSDKRLHGLERL